MSRKFWMIVMFLASATLLSLSSLWSPSLTTQAASPAPAAQAEVCAIVMTMPGAEDTDELLALLNTDRSEVVSNLIAMKRNMEQYEAEGYGWPNVIDSPSALDPKPGSWLIGALSMACEPQPANPSNPEG